MVSEHPLPLRHEYVKLLSACQLCLRGDYQGCKNYHLEFLRQMKKHSNGTMEFLACLLWKNFLCCYDIKIFLFSGMGIFLFLSPKKRNDLSLFVKWIASPFNYLLYILELKVHSLEHIETVELTSHILARYVILSVLNSVSCSFASGFMLPLIHTLPLLVLSKFVWILVGLHCCSSCALRWGKRSKFKNEKKYDWFIGS